MAKKRDFIFNKYGGRCAYCGEYILIDKMHIDHIKPLKRGYNQIGLIKINNTKGGNDIENLNPSCATCNLSKASFSIEKWRKELQMKTDRLFRDSNNFKLLHKFGLIKITNNPVIFYYERVSNG